MTIKEINIVIGGVGGQGNVLLERIIGISAMKEGYSVRAADTYGAAQRGGSVLSHLRIGSAVRSGLIPQGQGHILLGLEPGEALTVATKFLVRNGLVIVNTFPILPARVKVGEWDYPSVETILGLLGKITRNVIDVDANALARQVTGSERSMNIVMGGILIGLRFLPISSGTVKGVIEQQSGKFFQESIQAFEAGLEVGRQRLVAQMVDSIIDTYEDYRN